MRFLRYGLIYILLGEYDNSFPFFALYLLVFFAMLYLANRYFSKRQHKRIILLAVASGVLLGFVLCIALLVGCGVFYILDKRINPPQEKEKEDEKDKTGN